MERRARERKRVSLWSGIRGAVFPAFLLISASCVTSPVLSPPARIKGLEGYGSASLRGEAGFSKAKFSFVFELPRRGKVEALDVLGRTMYFVLFGDESSYLVVPSKKIYAQASPETMMGRVFGFGFSPEEIICLVSGRWRNGGAGGGEDSGFSAAWTLDRDANGRVRAGAKGDFRFEVIDFYRGLEVPRVFSFSQPPNEGRIRIKEIWFNRPLRPKAFDLEFLARYRSMTWAEMEGSLTNED